MEKLIRIISFLLLCLSAMAMPSAAVRVSVGSGGNWDYASMHDAIAALVPFTDDVIIELDMRSGEYTAEGIVESTNLFGGYSLYVVPVADFPVAATYYVNEDLEYDVPQSKTGVCRTTEYVKGTELEARRVTQGASESGNQFYVKNHLGSTLFLTDADAINIVGAVDYFPYGKKVNVGGTPDPVTQTYTGKELDRYDEDMAEGEDGEGWYYFGARYYDADIAAWTSVDPIGQFSSLYSYAGNGMNAISAYDQDGKEVIFTFETADKKKVAASSIIDNIVKSEAFMEMFGPMHADKKNIYDVKIVVDKSYFNKVLKDGKVKFEVGQCKKPKKENPNKIKGGDKNRYNIFIAADRSPAEVAATVFHELFHADQWTKGIMDFDKHHEMPELKSGEQSVKNAYK